MMTRMTALAVALLVAGTSLAQDQQAIRTQLFEETDALKAQAEELNAAFLAPESYEKAMEAYDDAGDTLADGRDLDRVREELAEADGYFQKAIETATLAETTFADLLAAREAALAADAPRYLERDWERAEEDLLDAAEVLEGGNLSRASNMAMDAQKRYRELEAEAINEKSKAE